MKAKFFGVKVKTKDQENIVKAIKIKAIQEGKHIQDLVYSIFKKALEADKKGGNDNENQQKV